jgi:internalin A
MTKLTEVDMEHNKIFDISRLDRINLTSLGFTNNRIEDVISLKCLTALTVLPIAENQISDISPLKSLTKLTELYLRENQIKSLR